MSQNKENKMTMRQDDVSTAWFWETWQAETCLVIMQIQIQLVDKDINIVNTEPTIIHKKEMDGLNLVQ